MANRYSLRSHLIIDRTIMQAAVELMQERTKDIPEDTTEEEKEKMRRTIRADLQKLFICCMWYSLYGVDDELSVYLIPEYKGMYALHKVKEKSMRDIYNEKIAASQKGGAPTGNKNAVKSNKTTL